jgi:hypothetical protein
MTKPHADVRRGSSVTVNLLKGGIEFFLLPNAAVQGASQAGEGRRDFIIEDNGQSSCQIEQRRLAERGVKDKAITMKMRASKSYQRDTHGTKKQYKKNEGET